MKTKQSYNIMALVTPSGWSEGNKHAPFFKSAAFCLSLLLFILHPHRDGGRWIKALLPAATHKTAFAGTTEDVAAVWGSFASSTVVLTAHFLDDRAAVLHQILWKGMHSLGGWGGGGVGVSLKVEDRKEIIRQLESGMENVSEVDQIRGYPNKHKKKP